MINPIKKHQFTKAYETILGMDGRPFLYRSDEINSPFTKTVDGKKYVYCIMSSVSHHLPVEDPTVYVGFKYRDIMASIGYKYDSVDPVEFVSKVMPVSDEEFELATSHLFDGILSELERSPYVEVKGRVVKVTGNEDSSFLSGMSKQHIVIHLEATDLDKYDTILSPEHFSNVYRPATEEEFLKSEQEYMDRKVREFEELGALGVYRYHIVESESFRDITMATVIRTHRFSGNEMYVEYEVRHMGHNGEEPVQTMVSEFNWFRNYYDQTEV